jgi:hypothetical protein
MTLFIRPFSFTERRPIRYSRIDAITRPIRDDDRNICTSRVMHISEKEEVVQLLQLIRIAGVSMIMISTYHARQRDVFPHLSLFNTLQVLPMGFVCIKLNANGREVHRQQSP